MENTQNNAAPISLNPLIATQDQATIRVHIAGYGGIMLSAYSSSARVVEIRTFLAQGWAGKNPVASAADRAVYRWRCPHGEVFYVKRYQMKGFNLFLRTLAGVNKAQKAWRIGRKMRRKNIGTPLPIAMLKKWRSLFRTEYLGITQGLTDAVSLDEAVARVQGRQHFRQKRRLIADVAKYMADLHLHKIYHSDFTVDNVLVRKREEGQGFDINLIDLDAVRTIPWISARRRESSQRKKPFPPGMTSPSQ